MIVRRDVLERAQLFEAGFDNRSCELWVAIFLEVVKQSKIPKLREACVDFVVFIIFPAKLEPEFPETLKRLKNSVR